MRGLKRRHGRHRVTIQVLFFPSFFFPSLPFFLLQRRYNRRLGNDAALPMEILSYEFSQMRIRAIYARTNGPRAAQKGS